MLSFFISVLLLFNLSEVPYREKNDFQVELKYNLKQRPPSENPTVRLQGSTVVQEVNGVSLPYHIINVRILNHKPEEVRFRCENNLRRSAFNTKASKSLDYMIDMGYIDDLKDGVSPNTYTVYAMSEEKNLLNKIVLHVQEDGTFLVNGEKRGKF